MFVQVAPSKYSSGVAFDSSQSGTAIEPTTLHFVDAEDRLVLAVREAKCQSPHRWRADRSRPGIVPLHAFELHLS